jgi:hypothetical protein
LFSISSGDDSREDLKSIASAIRSKLSEGQLNEAVELLIINFKDDKEVYEQALVLASSLNRLELESRIGTISSDDAVRNRNRIAYGLIELIRQIDE